MAPVAIAQTETGRISGTVSDASGAFVPGATVTLKGATTGVVRNTVSDENGRYVFSNVNPGPYQIIVELTGFNTSTSNVTVTVGSVSEVNTRLEIAGTTEAITVTAESAVINTVNAEVATTIREAQIRELPTITPYYCSAATSMEGVRVVSANCMFCHAGRINGQLVIGLGAADRDFTTDQVGLIDLAGGLISDPTEHAAWQRFRDRTAAIADYSRTLTIGVNPADSFTAALMAHRDPATMAWSAEPQLALPPPVVVPVDVPPLWRMSKKHAMFYTAGGRGDHAPIMMAASLLCSESIAEVQTIDAAFVDVRAWIEDALEPPAWPFAIDMALASRGEAVFEATCVRCHGTYGPDGVYGNQLVPLADVGTDSVLAQGESEFAARFVEWFAASFWGQTSRLEPQEGYIAPPLDGIWATAPYFHNGSVPTIEAVLAAVFYRLFGNDQASNN